MSRAVQEPRWPAPRATYRVQVRPGFTFDAVAAQAPYLARLGVTHVYLSPILQAAPGSTHGYDVVDHSRICDEFGGAEAFSRMCRQLAAQGLAAVADVVPNHMAVPTPVRLNAALWSVLRDGPGSPYARWFDVDWTVPHRAVLMPVLGDRIGDVLAAGQLRLDLDGDEPVLRYFEHEFPVRPGTETLPLAELADRQWYRLAWWRVADDEVNYRRFFDIDTLAAVRVEDEEVFAATHALLLDLVAQGELAGFRIDHPDGLADPRAYLRRLSSATGGAWVVVEKILEDRERLPADWPCAGTTGYDALAMVGGLFVDPAGAAPLSSLLVDLTGDSDDLDAVVEASKRLVVTQGLYAEVERVVDLLVETCHADITLRDHTLRALRAAVVELLVAMDRYRAYVIPGQSAPAESVEVVERAARRARERLPEELRATVDLVCDLVLGRPVGFRPPSARESARREEIVVRFQQTCGPVMAKGVEDTAFYRWHRLVSLNEVGGNPARLGVIPEEFHAFAARIQRDWPLTMTTLSTHDTKRSEDVRARLSTIAGRHAEWAEAVRGWMEAAARHRSPEGWPDAPTAYLVWQTLVGTWDDAPIAPDRLLAYLEKATREAKRHTSWTWPDPTYDVGVAGYATAVLSDARLMNSVGAFCAGIAADARVAVLGQKLVQLAMPGVPDTYQGCEIVDLSLVDPDNRRDVDFDERARRLERLDAGNRPADLSDEKLLVASRVVRLRRERPEWFIGPTALYAPVATTTGHAIAFARGDATDPAGPAVVAVATRLPLTVDRLGGWDVHSLSVPPGSWRDRLTGRDLSGGPVLLADLLGELPVALLVREG
jgi:(1->4)-alpha-D-glucan 1-alpha-D-glucosylmutase